MNVKEMIGEFIFKALFICIINLIVAGCGVLIYNLVLPSAFGLPTLSYWQFYGIMLVVNCLHPINFNSKE